MRRGEGMGRKGLSPLIATILLIAFAVSLGVLIISWAQPPKQAEAPPNPCEGISLSLQQVPGGSAICYASQTGHLVFVVKNTGTKQIPLLVLRGLDEQLNVKEQQVTAQLATGDWAKFDMPYSTSTPSNLTADIIPAVMVSGQRHLCVTEDIQKVGVPAC